MTASQSNASMISRLVAFLLPLVLAAYWPVFGTGQDVHIGVIALRLILIAGVSILALVWIGGKMTPTEMRWVGILGAYACVLLATSALGGNVSRGVHNWVRVVAVYGVALALSRPLRHKATAQALGVSLGAAGFISLAFIMAIYLYFAGISLPTYEHIRILKAQVLRASGIALNPLASATLLFCILSLCLVPSGWTKRAIATAIAVLASLFTGSRAPLGLSVVAVGALYLITLLHKRNLVTRMGAGVVLCVVMAGGLTALLTVDPMKLSALTEGRYDVWTVGMEKFLERPLTGYGAESWKDDLVSRLPGYYEGTSGLGRLRAGGYHSEFVTLLAEGGLFCFIPAMIIFGLLFKSCWRVAFHPSTTRFNGQALIFTFFLIFLRAGVEVPGMFGYGEDVMDYLAAIFVAIVVSRASLLETGRENGLRTGVSPGPGYSPLITAAAEA